MSEYIKANAIAWSISWEDEKMIDKINILQATQQSMHTCIHDILKKHEKKHESINQSDDTYKLLIDGNYFKPYYHYNFSRKKIEQISHECIVGGDDKYSAIAAASILAKVARDSYIEELCKEFPYLDDNYSILSNKGYGTKKHMDGIKQHGITEWHRHSYNLPLLEKVEPNAIPLAVGLESNAIPPAVGLESNAIPPFALGLTLPFLKVEEYTCSMAEDCPIKSNCFSLSPECKKYSSTNYAPFF